MAFSSLLLSAISAANPAARHQIQILSKPRADGSSGSVGRRTGCAMNAGDAALWMLEIPRDLNGSSALPGTVAVVWTD